MNEEVMSKFIYNKTAVIRSLEKAIEDRKKRLCDKVDAVKEALMKRRRYFIFGPKINENDALSIIRGDRYQWHHGSPVVFKTMLDEIIFRDNFEYDIIYLFNLIDAAKATMCDTIELSAKDFCLIKAYY